MTLSTMKQSVMVFVEHFDFYVFQDPIPLSCLHVKVLL